MKTLILIASLALAAAEDKPNDQPVLLSSEDALKLALYTERVQAATKIRQEHINAVCIKAKITPLTNCMLQSVGEDQWMVYRKPAVAAEATRLKEQAKPEEKK